MNTLLTASGTLSPECKNCICKCSDFNQVITLDDTVDELFLANFSAFPIHLKTSLSFYGNSKDLYIVQSGFNLRLFRIEDQWFLTE